MSYFVFCRSQNPCEETEPVRNRSLDRKLPPLFKYSKQLNFFSNDLAYLSFYKCLQKHSPWFKIDLFNLPKKSLNDLIHPVPWVLDVMSRQFYLIILKHWINANWNIYLFIFVNRTQRGGYLNSFPNPKKSATLRAFRIR